MKDNTTLIKIFCQLQSLTHTIDELQDTKIFKQDLKRKTNAYMSAVNTKLNIIGRQMSESEVNSFNQIVKKLDDTINSISII